MKLSLKRLKSLVENTSWRKLRLILLCCFLLSFSLSYWVSSAL